MKIPQHFLMLGLIVIGAAAGIPVLPAAQEAPDGGPSNEDFASANAILDTSIPFAIGAVEARQSLRGAFGWDTFQEGQVMGVYFRFDPDGYARFSASPRLDSDVFEVICRPRTLVCMARKDNISVTLDSRGAANLEFPDIIDDDRFFLLKGVSEIEIPSQVRQPLTRDLELLLSNDGDLLIRRGEQEVHRISLAGFMPAVAYMRWVAAQQDYSVLPSDWPVPNSRQIARNDQPGANGNWAVGRPDPQQQPIIARTQAPQTTPEARTRDLEAEVIALRQQLAGLADATAMRAPAQTARPLTESNGAFGGQGRLTASIGTLQAMPEPAYQRPPAAFQPTTAPATQYFPRASGVNMAQPDPLSPDQADRIVSGLDSLVAALQSMAAIAATLQGDVQSLRESLMSAPLDAGTQAGADRNTMTGPDQEQLAYLTGVIGLSDAAARRLLSRAPEPTTTEPVNSYTDGPQTAPDAGNVDALVMQILRDLDGERQPEPQAGNSVDTLGGVAAREPVDEFVLLRDYFDATSGSN